MKLKSVYTQEDVIPYKRDLDLISLIENKMKLN